MNHLGDPHGTDANDLEERLEWVCGDCALIWPYPNLAHECSCDGCDGALVDPRLVVTAIA